MQKTQQWPSWLWQVVKASRYLDFPRIEGRSARAAERKRIRNISRACGDYPHGHCRICYSGFLAETSYHLLNICDECARRMGAAWWERHSGEPHPDFDPEGYKHSRAALNEHFAHLFKKKPIGQALRTQVFERDAYRCRQCGDHKSLVVDHIYPESKGGTCLLYTSDAADE